MFVTTHNRTAEADISFFRRDFCNNLRITEATWTRKTL